MQRPDEPVVTRVRTAAFSIISPNYRHFARVLMDSVRRQHPEWDRFVLVAGGAPGAGDEAFTELPVDELPLPDRRQFYFRYDLLELNTAVKPWMFEHLFGRGYERVIYFDPDIVLYSPLAELDEAEAGTLLTLTPHLTGSITGDDHPSERSILQAGTYNLGFLALRRHPSLDAFIRWWQEKLEFQCVVDTARGLFVDQKWIDLVPGLFPGVRILRHDGYNVAYWNLEQRTVAGHGEQATVNGQPLRFFHFSGFNPSRPKSVSRHHVRLKAADTGDAAGLFEDYAAALRDAGYETHRRAPYSWDRFADGSPISRAARIAYRNSAALQEACGPDPFQHPEKFRTSRETGRSPVGARIALRSYMFLSRARPLVRLLPESLRTAMREYLLGRPDSAPPAPRAAAALPEGLNIVGYFSRDTGVGESARLCARACEAAGIPTHLIDVDAAEPQAERAVYRASIHHVNADQIISVRQRFGAVFDASSCNIGCWHWELPELPEAWVSSAEPLDEIWAPSSFIQSALSRKLPIPIVHMPHGIEIGELEACSPHELGVPPGRFTFLCMFDFDSFVERKNPLAAVEAFRRAFPRDAPAALLIKTVGGDGHGEEIARLEETLRGVPNIFLTDRVLSRARVNGLIAGCDAVVSLHRSEGFGLILAEAMALGRIVIATGWSGNVDFMNGGNSCPVGYELVSIDRTAGPYEAGQQWAEPDVEHAAQFMRRVVDEAGFARRLGARARHTIHSQFSAQAAGRRYRQRLSRLGLLAARVGFEPTVR